VRILSQPYKLRHGFAKPSRYSTTIKGIYIQIKQIYAGRSKRNKIFEISFGVSIVETIFVNVSNPNRDPSSGPIRNKTTHGFVNSWKEKTKPRIGNNI